MKDQKISISFKGKPTSAEKKLIIAVISAGFKAPGKITSSSLIHEEPEMTLTVNRFSDYVHKQVMVSTGLSLPHTMWQRNGDGKYHAAGAYKHYNEQLDKWKMNIELLYNSISNKSLLTASQFKEKIKKHIVGSEDKQGKKLSGISSKDIPFYQFILNIIEEERQLQKVNGTADSSLRLYSSVARTIQKWDANISISEMNGEHIDRFFVWFSKEQSNGNYYNLAKSVIKKYIRIAISKKLNSLLTGDDLRLMKTLKKKSLPQKAINFLNPEELDLLLNNDLKELSDNHRIVRDLFVAAAWSGGKRYSDISNCILMPDRNGGHYIENISKKTDTYTKQPAYKRVIRIWENYSGSFPKTPPNAEYNKLLIEVCKHVGIKAVTSHDARRSFATNHLTNPKYNKLSPLDVCWFGGWGTNIKQMMTYCAIDKEAMYKRFDAVLKSINE